MQLVKDLIRRLNSYRQGCNEPPEPTCARDVLQSLQRDAIEKLSVRLPDEYITMLQFADGLHFNGLYILASEERPITGHPEAGSIEGVIADNLEYWSLLDRDLIVLGYEEAFAYAHDVIRKRYVRVLRSNKHVARDYCCFDEMLSDALDWAYIPIKDIIPQNFVLSSHRE